MKIIEVKNPRWANAEKSAVDVEVNFESLPEEFVTFTASAYDTTSYGVEIFNLATKGLLGELGEFEVKNV